MVFSDDTGAPVTFVFSIVQYVSSCSGVPRNFVRGAWVQQIQLRSEDREKGDLGAVAP